MRELYRIPPFNAIVKCLMWAKNPSEAAYIVQDDSGRESLYRVTGDDADKAMEAFGTYTEWAQYGEPLYEEVA